MIFAVMVGSSARVAVEMLRAWSDDRDEPDAAARIAHRYVAAGEDTTDLVEWLLGMAGALLLELEATDPELPLSTLFDDLEARLG
jgi:hypothetical protein